jgi:hypothetical protein
VIPKLRLTVPRRKRRRRPREQAPKEIVPQRRDPFDEARERLKREISPPAD